MSTVAIIPARGGSKGLPGKNLRPLAGKPLIAHSILAARECPLVSRVIVSTEDAAIKAAALHWGAEVIDRPAELATDTASSESVIRHVLSELERAGVLPSHFALLQPTSPLRTAEHLAACLAHFAAHPDARAVVSVCEPDHPPHKAFLIEDEYLQPLFDWESLGRPRQLLPRTVRPNGAIYATASRLFLDTGSLYGQPVLAFAMSRDASVDVDAADDLARCEAILARR